MAHLCDRFSERDCSSTTRVSLPKRVVLERSRRELSYDGSFGVRTLLVVEKSSFTNRSHRCAIARTLTVRQHTKTECEATSPVGRCSAVCNRQDDTSFWLAGNTNTIVSGTDPVRVPAWTHTSTSLCHGFTHPGTRMYERNRFPH